MKRIIWIATAFVGLAISLLFVLSLEDTVDITVTTEAPDLPVVSVVAIKSGTYAGYISVQTEVKPRWTAELTAIVSSRVLDVLPDAFAGSRVEAGTELVLLEDSAYSASLRASEQALAQAELNLVDAHNRVDLARKEWLRSGQKGEPTPLALQLPELEVAQKATEAARARVKADAVELAATRITAPFSGYVSARQVSLGQTVNPGTPLLKLIGDETLEIAASLSVEEWNLLAKDWAERPVELLNAAGEAVGAATIKRGGGYLEPDTRQYRVFMEVSGSPEPNVLPGEFVTARLQGAAVPNSLQVPESALTRDGFVWHLDLENRLRRFRAEVILRNETDVILRSVDPEVSEWRIVTTPLASFLPGTEVTPPIAKD